MSIYSSILNPGAPVKTSIPLVDRRLGQGFGLGAQSINGKKADQEILISLSPNSRLRNQRTLEAGNAHTLSSSPLNQALDALSGVASKISELQAKYSKAPAGSIASESFSSELEKLASEYQRITSSGIFESPSTAYSSSNQSSSLEFEDGNVKATLRSGNSARIDALNSGFSGLKSISRDQILGDSEVSDKIQAFIKTIKSAVGNQSKEGVENAETKGETTSVLIGLPEAGIRTVGAAQGLTVALVGFSNQDLLKAAAAHVNIDSTNVLILTFNPEEEDSEEEKQLKGEKPEAIEVSNAANLPSTSESTLPSSGEFRANPELSQD